MPLIELKEINDDVIALWQLNGEEESIFETRKKNLTEKQKKQVTTIRNPLMRKQRIAARLLLEELNLNGFNISYNKLGKPLLTDSEMEVSFSHSKDIISVMISPEIAATDVQHIERKIERIIPRFLSDEEMSSLKEESVIEHANLLWSAKETLYKAYAKKELIFREQIEVLPFQLHPENGEMTGKIRERNSGKMLYEWRLKYEFKEDFVLTYLWNA